MVWITDESLASLAFVLRWEKNGIRHVDATFAQRVNLWRDILPQRLRKLLLGAMAGDRLEAGFSPGEMLPVPNPRLVHRVRRRQVEGRLADRTPLTPRYGRFYPRGILRGVANVFPGNVIPFRCTAADAEGISADLNHPLAGVPVCVEAVVHDVRPKFEEHGGTLYDWLEEAAGGGAGMQARFDGCPTDFFALGAFDRQDETADAGFYAQPRLVQHIDAHARQTISDLYGRLIPPGARVLDLMSSWVSHLPENLELGALTGLGLNADELAANPRLTARTVHDLNRAPVLPYGAAAFDAVICTASVEYLTRPAEVVAEVARVLVPGGVFAVSFSNRWFPPKAIRLWSELHPFERLGFVLEIFQSAGRFQGLETFSSQGWPRPEDDKYYGQILTADPVFAAWGTCTAGRRMGAP
jgi:SAM-dependent methyltransferase